MLPVGDGETGTTYILSTNLPETFQPTVHLRYFIHRGTGVRKLQQAWGGSKGTVEWRAIEEVCETNEEYSKRTRVENRSINEYNNHTHPTS